MVPNISLAWILDLDFIISEWMLKIVQDSIEDSSWTLPVQGNALWYDQCPYNLPVCHEQHSGIVLEASCDGILG